MTSHDEPSNSALYRAMHDAALADYLVEDLNADIGAALKSARETMNMLQSQVAERMGVNASRISQIETTRGVSMTLDVLARFVAAIGCRLDVDIVNPMTDEVLTSLPVVPLSFLPVEEVERRASVSSVHKPLPRKATPNDSRTRETNQRYKQFARKIEREQLNAWSALADVGSHDPELATAA